ncbi:MAG: hypothetical protein AN485_03710 [Anabaena sp. MDT14b]|jgi:tetratricopeptide (TPR) repeat protein|nr:MAG: hypothetical protein AN485_03710 [Anabaena sp. MDT14b]
MISLNKLKDIVNRIFLRQQTEDDLVFLQNYSAISGNKNVSQQGNDNINIGQARDVSFNITQHLTPENIQELISLASNSILSSQDDIALSISVSNDFTEDALIRNIPFDNQERTLNYQIDEIEQQLEIIPQMEYLSKLANNIPICDLGLVLDVPPYFKWQFPNLDLRIVNNTNKTIYITDIFLEVEKSVLDPYPVLVIPGEEVNVLHFLIVNDGWGEVQNASVKFNLVPWGHPISFTEPYKHKIHIGNFLYQYNVDVSDALRKSGVNIEAFGTQNLDEIANGYINACFPGMPFVENSLNGDIDINNYSEDWLKDGAKRFLMMLEALGEFKNGVNIKRNLYSAIAYGEISFTGTTHEQKLKASIVKFFAEVPLLIFGQYGDGYYSSFQYSAKLDIDRENYKVLVQSLGSSVSQFIKTGEIDRFNIRVGALKSSLHNFILKLIYNNGQFLLSPPISLKIFVPRSEANGAISLDTLRLEQGQNLAEQGDLDGAILKFQEALRLNSSLNFDPRAKASQIVSSSLVYKARHLVRDYGKVDEALAAFTEAEHLCPSLQISAQSWSALCWHGSLHGYAGKVLYAGDKAVEIDPECSHSRDSRGLARALTGNILGAIEDFQAHIQWIDNTLDKNVENNEPLSEGRRTFLMEVKLRRQNWIQ